MGDDNGNIFTKAIGTVSEAEKKVKNTLDPSKNGLSNAMGAVSSGINDIMQKMLGVISPFAKVQKVAADLAKAVGLAGKSIMSNSERLVKLNHDMQLSAQYGMSSEDMMKLQGQLMMSIGRNVQIEQVSATNPDDTAFENAIAASQAFSPEMVGQIVGAFDKLGISMKSASKATGKIYQEAGEYGINLQTYTENIVKNIGMAQSYNFKNGVNGLKEMARKAAELRQDMRQIAQFADKVGSVTGAVETAANLQVLGGSFAALSNPLTMLNKSLTDINGLQDMAIGMTEGAAQYNQTTHQIEMDPVTRQIMKRAAESMGMSADALIDQAYAQARRGEMNKQMNGMGLSDNLQNLLRNVGQIDEETGLAGAVIDGEFRNLADIAADPELQEQLVSESRSQSDDIKVIAKSVMDIQKIIAGKTGQLENEAARNAIMPGVISGKSSYDLAMEMVTQRIDKEVTDAAGKIDQTLTNIQANFVALTGSILTDLTKPFAATNPDDFAKKMGEGWANFLGEGARKPAETVAGGLANWAEVIDSKFKEYGFSPMTPFHTDETVTPHGNTTTAQTARQGAGEPTSSVALAARDVSLQATNFSVAGTQSVHLEPLAATGELNRATAAATGEPDINALITNALAAIGYSVTTPIEPTTNGNQNGTVEIRGTEQSIPGAQVNVPVGNNMQANLTEQRVETRQNAAGDTNAITVTGTLTMNVNGDNGKIGTVDIIKMLENNPSFRQELAKALADTYAKMNKSGLPSN